MSCPVYDPSKGKGGKEGVFGKIGGKVAHEDKDDDEGLKSPEAKKAAIAGLKFMKRRKAKKESRKKNPWITAKDKLTVMTIIFILFVVLSETLLETSLSKMRTVRDTKRVYNLLWKLAYLHRDHDAYLLCAKETRSTRWLENKLDTFKDTYIDTKRKVYGIKGTSSKYRSFAKAFLLRDQSPECSNGELIESGNHIYKDAMYTLKHSITEVALESKGKIIFLDICATIALWFLVIFYCYAWKCTESWDPCHIEALKNKKPSGAFIHDIAVPIVVADKNMVITNVNEAATTVFGYKRDELLNHKVTMLMPPSYRKNHQNFVDDYIRTRKAGIIGNTSGRAIPGIHKNGSELRLILNLSVSGDDPKNNPVFTALFQDVTEQFKAQEADKKKQEEMDTVVAAQNEMLKNLNAPVIIANEQMIITQVNNAAQTTFGYKENEMLGQNVTILMPTRIANDHESYVDHYKNTGEKRVIGLTRRLKGLHRNGTELSLILNMAKSTDATGGKFIAIFQDVTKVET